jgi:phosphoglycolate phosphatase
VTAQSIKTVLFDLDGTLLDTAPDMAAALNLLSAEHDRPQLAFEQIRGKVSAGAAALIELGLDIRTDSTEYAQIVQRFLELYRENLYRETCLFPGMDAVLDQLDHSGITWGICTNKPGWLTEPLLEAAGLAERVTCIVSGDTLPERKPRPEPLWHALELCSGESEQAIYVGDAARDIEAGRAAGLRTAVALYGYIGDDENPRDWQADHYIETPAELLGVLRLTRATA